MDIEEEVEKELKHATEKAVEEDILERDGKPEMPQKTGAEDEKIERQAFSETGASMTPQQIEFLVRQRTSMDNEELRKFLAGEHEVLEEGRNWKPFSRTEEKFLLQNAQQKNLQEIAESIDRDPEEVELQLKIMGLENVME